MGQEREQGRPAPVDTPAVCRAGTAWAFQWCCSEDRSTWKKGERKRSWVLPRAVQTVNPAVLEIFLGRAKRELVEDKVDAHLRGAGEGKTF